MSEKNNIDQSRNYHHQFQPMNMIFGSIIGLCFVFLAILIASYATKISPPRLEQSISTIATNKQNSFDVTGKSEIETIPDQAELRLGVTSTAASVKEAQDATNLIINNYTTALAGIDIVKNDIKTTGYSLYPDYDYNNATNKRKITSYTASTSIIITMNDFAKVNQAIDLATQLGINEINGVNFMLSTEKEKEVKKEARELAIKNAKTNADELASLTGMRIGKIINITEDNYSNFRPETYNYEYALKATNDMAAGTDIQAGATTYSYNVILSYETL